MPLRNDAFGQVSAGTVPTLIMAAQPERDIVLLYNVGTVTAYLGAGTALTTANGYPIPQDTHHVWSGPNSIYAVTSAGAADIRYHYSA